MMMTKSKESKIPVYRTVKSKGENFILVFE